MGIKIEAVRTNEAFEIEQNIRKNGGYCPCKLEKTEDNKCMCKDFRREIENAKTKQDTNMKTCHCGLYTVVWEKDV